MERPSRSTKPFAWLGRNILSLGLVSLFTDLSTEMSYAIIPIFLKEVLKVQPIFIGLIEAIAESTASVLKSFSGYISDRFHNRKIFIFIGYTFSAFVKPLLAFATQGWHVLVVRFSDRFGKGIRTAPRDALIADSTNQEYLGRAFGFHRALDTLGAVLGPALAFLILALSFQNYRLLFGLAFIPGIIAVAIIIFSVREKHPGARPPVFSFSLRDLNKPLWMFFGVMTLFTLGNSSDAFLLLRAKDLGVSAVHIPLLWLVFNVAYFAWSYPAGVISDRIGKNKTIAIGFLIFSLCYGGLAITRHAAGAWLIFIIYGLYYGMTEGNLKAYVAELAPTRIRGTVFGLYHTIIGVTLLPANLLMGLLWQRVGFSRALLVGAGLSFISAVLLFLLLGKIPQNRPAIKS
jgi:MFS family permease